MARLWPRADRPGGAGTRGGRVEGATGAAKTDRGKKGGGIARSEWGGEVVLNRLDRFRAD